SARAGSEIRRKSTCITTVQQNAVTATMVRPHTITRVQQANRALDCSLETETEQLINELLNGPGAAVRNADPRPR
ncbi:hypothetical protein ABZ455_29040, partial [Streptomyces avermitilis]